MHSVTHSTCNYKTETMPLKPQSGRQPIPSHYSLSDYLKEKNNPIYLSVCLSIRPSIPIIIIIQGLYTANSYCSALHNGRQRGKLQCSTIQYNRIWRTLLVRTYI